MIKATRLSGLTPRVMSSVSLPVSFSANRKGFNSYLKSIGVDPKNQHDVLMFGMPFEKFKSLDRRFIDDKIAEAGAEAERLHDVYIEATKDGRKTDAALALAGWNRRSNEFLSLVKSKYND